MSEKEWYKRMLGVAQRMVDSLTLAAVSLQTAQGGLNIYRPAAAVELTTGQKILYQRVQEFHFELAENIACYRAQTALLASVAQESCDRLQEQHDALAPSAAAGLELQGYFAAFEHLVFVHLAQVSLLRDCLRASSMLLLNLLRNLPLTRSVVYGTACVSNEYGELDRAVRECGILLEMSVESLVVGRPEVTAGCLAEAAARLDEVAIQANCLKLEYLRKMAPHHAEKYEQVVMLHSGKLNIGSVSPALNLV